MMQTPPNVARPPVLTWYKAYCLFMVVLYLLTTASGVALVVFAEQIAAHEADSSPLEMMVVGWLLGGLSVLLLATFAVALLLPRLPWVWIFHLVLICLGMTSACCLPATVPLLIFWIKPEVRAWYGRDQPAAPVGGVPVGRR